jgi:hypothetical protein
MTFSFSSELSLDPDAFAFALAASFAFAPAVSVELTVGAPLLAISVVHALKPNTTTTNEADKRNLLLFIFTISFRPVIGHCPNRLKTNLKNSRRKNFFVSVKFFRQKTGYQMCEQRLFLNNRAFQVFIPKELALLTCDTQPNKLACQLFSTKKMFGLFLVLGIKSLEDRY